MPGCTPQMGWFRQSVAITRKLGLCSASVAVHWQQWEPLWMGRRGAFNGFYCAMGPPDLLLDKFDYQVKSQNSFKKMLNTRGLEFLLCAFVFAYQEIFLHCNMSICGCLFVPFFLPHQGNGLLSDTCLHRT